MRSDIPANVGAVGALGAVGAIGAIDPVDAVEVVEVVEVVDVADVVDVVDVGELYGLLARRLEQIVRLDVRAPDAVIEDACSFAWTRLLYHRHRVARDTVVAWLARTAVHEAFKLLRRDRRELSLEAAIEQIGQPPSPDGPAPQDLVEERERLAGLRRLPERQQRILWLQAFGLSYAEIAAREGCTLRTVERQLLRAKQRVREPELG